MVFAALGSIVVRSAPFVLIFGVLLSVITLVNWYVIRNSPLDQVKFGNLQTFRDLSLCIAERAGDQEIDPELPFAVSHMAS